MQDKEAHDQKVGCIALIVLAVGGFGAWFTWHYVINVDMSRAEDCKKWMIAAYEAKGQLHEAGDLSYLDIKQVKSMMTAPGTFKGDTAYVMFVIDQNGSEQTLGCQLNY